MYAYTYTYLYMIHNQLAYQTCRSWVCAMYVCFIIYIYITCVYIYMYNTCRYPTFKVCLELPEKDSQPNHPDFGRLGACCA